MPPAFHPYGTSHQAVLVLTAVLLGLLLLASRTRHAPVWERLLGSVLLLQFPGTSLIIHDPDGIADRPDLAAAAVLRHRQHRRRSWRCGRGPQIWCEIVYFFGLAGTFQGLITPALLHDYPDMRFFAFLLLHSGVSITAFYVVTAMKHRPAPGAVARMMLVSLAWYAVAAVINLVLGTNYAFQCAKPAQGSLFDHLGPWPWYNFSAIGLGVVFYSALYLPFAFRKPAPSPA
jgi:hypothetical protein